MTRATTAGRVVRSKRERTPLCIALSGKGVPGSGGLEQAVEAVARTARALHDLTRRRGHEWKPRDPEVRLRTPAGVRGGAGWTVRVEVPTFVTERELREATGAAARHAEIAKNIRLVPLSTEVAPPRPGPAGRDRLPGQLRRTRSGSPQHRAREARG